MIAIPIGVTSQPVDPSITVQSVPPAAARQIVFTRAAFNDVPPSCTPERVIASAAHQEIGAGGARSPGAIQPRKGMSEIPNDQVVP